MTQTQQMAPQLVAGKVAVITGSTRGIGRGIAEVMGSSGAKVIVTGRAREAVATTISELTALGIETGGVAAELRDEGGPARIIDAAVQKFGRIDVLVCNAGIYPEATIRAMTRAQWSEVIDSNLTSVYGMVHAAAPFLQDQGSGRIILISSITGTLVGYPGHTHYAATKAAMGGFMRAAALEFAPFNVTVNTVAPGSIESPGLTALGLGSLADYAIPMRRLGTPADIGWAVSFLASDYASFVTGHTFVVDGGQVVPEVLGTPA